MRNWPDEMVSRINCFDLQDWLPELAQWLDLNEEAFLPREAREEYVLRAPQRGITLTFRHPHAGYSDMADVSRWILESAHFLSSSNLPFGLDVRAETLESAKHKLGSDTAGGLSRVSFFLPDFRVIDLAFGKSGQGIDEARIVRLGRELSWNDLPPVLVRTAVRVRG
ncbi:hypothetical protein [Burkholderia ubonensis]|uniref:hypothetical protein n=1 Tax=Burkholderia ubonensis TaxID=101571 RepID=UPI0012F8EFDD|nr:hypothetical protein [Burkholderia ubonensis]